MKETNWQDKAACRDKTGLRLGHDPDAYREMPDEGSLTNIDEYNAFRRRCFTHCLVRNECLQEALRWERGGRQGRHGIWGGLTPTQREDKWRKDENLRVREDDLPTA